MAMAWVFRDRRWASLGRAGEPPTSSGLAGSCTEKVAAR